MKKTAIKTIKNMKTTDQNMEDKIAELEIEIEGLKEELRRARGLLGGLYTGNNDHTCITRFFQQNP